MKKNLIIGTSNSNIKNSYYSFLDSNKFDRCSIGDTTSLSGVYTLLNKTDLQNYKFAIIDFNVNEQNYMMNSSYPLEWCISSFCFVLKTLINNKIIPIILILEHESSNWLESYQKIICKNLKINYIDISQVTNDYPQVPYADSSHYIKEIQKIIADKITHTVESINYNDYTYPKLPKEIETLEFFTQKQVINFSNDFLPNKTIKCTTSLISVVAQNISKKLTVRIPNNYYLCGLAYWHNNDTPIISIQQLNSNVAISKNLHLKYTKGFFVRSVGYQNNQIKGDFSIELSQDSKIMEPTQNEIQYNNSNESSLLLVDIIFSNQELFNSGKNLINYFNLKLIKCDYTLINAVNSNYYPKTELIIAKNNFRLSYLHFLLTSKSKISKTDLLKYSEKVMDSYYKFFLIGNYLSDNLEQIMSNFHKALKLKSNYLHLYYVFACTLANKGYYDYAIQIISEGLDLNASWAAGLKRKNLIKEKLENNMKLSIKQSIKNVFFKEIQSLNNAINLMDEQSYWNAINFIENSVGKIIVTGVGKSGHIASKIAATMASTGTPAFFVHPGEACHGDLGMIESNDLIIAISHSGESSEIMTILPICKRKGIKIITITSNPNSSMAKIADIHLCTYVTEEAGSLNLAPTTSTTVTLVIGDALAITLAERRKFTKEDFAASHPGGALGKRLLLLNENIMHTDNQIPLVKTNQTVAETIIEITEKKLGFAIVVNEENEKLVGIFTDGDLRRTLAQKIDLNNTRIGDVAHTNCITVKPYEKASESLKIMQENCINGLVVISDDEQVLGAINIHDLIAIGLK